MFLFKIEKVKAYIWWLRKVVKIEMDERWGKAKRRDFSAGKEIFKNRDLGHSWIDIYEGNKQRIFT